MGRISEQNVAIVAQALALYLSGDLDAGHDLFAADVIVTEDSQIPRGSTYVGHAGLARWFNDDIGQLDGLEEVRFEIEHLIDSGENVVVLVRMVATAAGSGERVELDYAQVWTIRDGQVSSIHVHLDRANAISAARAVEQQSH